MFGPLIYFLYHKYGTVLQFTGYPIDYLISAILSGIFSAIFCAGRNARTPELSSDPLGLGGLQMANLFISAAMAIIFGLLAGLFLKYIPFLKESTIN